ncbi:MAG: hypothetical protein N4A45_02750 [Flavobacteriales bacterium]|jgi:sugar O-acyltransferase (sialic acid O-acetyltransferase NeuD family)|nr:hypothetical protein [Flavobacteriales bacterium]
MAKNKFAFIGFGDLGLQLYHLVLDSVTNIDEMIVFDDQLNPNTYEFIDSIHPFLNYSDHQFENYQFVIALGYKHLILKQRIMDELLSKGRIVPNIIHSTCFIHPTVIIGNGNVFYPLSNIDINVEIGNGNLFNNSVVISHDNKIGHSNFVAPSACFCGAVKIGNQNFIGAHATISNSIKIGSNCAIYLRTAVTKNLEDGEAAIGYPMKKLKNKLVLK